MNSVTESSKKIGFFFIVVSCLLVLFAVNDVQTSGQGGNAGIDRGMVYGLIISIVSLFCIYTIFHIHKFPKQYPVVGNLCSISIWILISNIVNGTMDRSGQIHLMLSVLWIMIYSCIYIYTQYHNNFRGIITVYIILLIVYYCVNIYAQTNMAITYDKEYGMTSFSYYILALFPFAFLIQNKVLRNAVIGFSIVMVLFSFKRGPIITLPCMLVAYFLSNTKIGRASHGIGKVVLVSALFVIAFLVINKLSNNFLMARFSSSELSSASGRDEMWRIALSNIENRGFVPLLIGAGSGSSIRLLGTGIHNEWLEFLFSFGLVGITLYLFLFISLFKRAIALTTMKSCYAPVYSMAVAFFFFSGLSDGFYFVYWTIYFFSLIGVVESLVNREQFLFS